MINITLLSVSAKIPTRGSDESAGLDISTVESVTIPPGIKAIVKTGIAMSMPIGFVGLIWSRSKLAMKLGLTAELIKVCENTGDIMIGHVDSDYTGKLVKVCEKTGKIMGGVVDSDYRGEIMIGLLNTSQDPIEIRVGDKVAQMIIQRHYSDMQINVVDELDKTMRGKAGVNCSENRLR